MTATSRQVQFGENDTVSSNKIELLSNFILDTLDKMTIVIAFKRFCFIKQNIFKQNKMFTNNACISPLEILMQAFSPMLSHQLICLPISAGVLTINGYLNLPLIISVKSIFPISFPRWIKACRVAIV